MCLPPLLLLLPLPPPLPLLLLLATFRFCPQGSPQQQLWALLVWRLSLLAPDVLPAGWQTARRVCGHSLARQVGGLVGWWVGGWVHLAAVTLQRSDGALPAPTQPSLEFSWQQRLKPSC